MRLHLIRRWTRRIAAILLVMAGLASWWMVRDAQAQGGPVKMEWLGWSFFRFTSLTGKVILTTPFITGNPDAAVKLEEVTRADLILVPNGHRDEIGDTVAIAKKTGAKPISPFELGTWFISKGVPEAQVQRRNPGSRSSGHPAARPDHRDGGARGAGRGGDPDPDHQPRAWAGPRVPEVAAAHDGKE